MQRDRYFEAIEAAGFELVSVRENLGYRFVSERARQRDPQVRRDERVPPRPKALALA